MIIKSPAIAARSRSVFLCLMATTGLILASNPANSADTTTWPERVTANYDITFNGFNIGSFRFDANVGPEGYRLAGDAKISALLGVFQWRGLTRASGWVQGNKPRPAGFTFDFKSNANRGAVKIAFRKDRVTDFSMRPLAPTLAGEVPLKRQHLQKVFDPLTTVMALTRASGRNPCAQTLPVFDGKQRFDLYLSYKGQEQLRAVPGLGRAGRGYVCGVRYRPVAGYVPDNATLSMAREHNIAVVLRPVHQARLMMPDEIRIPTMAGTVRLTIKNAAIKMPQTGRLAAAQ